MTLNPKNRDFGEFFAISGCDTHFNNKYCGEMAGDRPGQPVYGIFSIKRTFLRI